MGKIRSATVAHRYRNGGASEATRILPTPIYTMYISRDFWT